MLLLGAPPLATYAPVGAPESLDAMLPLGAPALPGSPLPDAPEGAMPASDGMPAVGKLTSATAPPEAGLPPAAATAGIGLLPDFTPLGAVLLPAGTPLGVKMLTEDTLLGAVLLPEATPLGIELLPEDTLLGVGLLVVIDALWVIGLAEGVAPGI